MPCAIISGVNACTAMILHGSATPDTPSASMNSALQTVRNDAGWCPRPEALAASPGLREILGIGAAAALAIMVLKPYARRYFGLPGWQDRFVAEPPPPEGRGAPDRRNANAGQHAGAIAALNAQMQRASLSDEQLQELRDGLFAAGARQGYADADEGLGRDLSEERASTDLRSMASHPAGAQLLDYWRRGYQQGYESALGYQSTPE